LDEQDFRRIPEAVQVLSFPKDFDRQVLGMS
jgi:hypothetical protein